MVKNFKSAGKHLISLLLLMFLLSGLCLNVSAAEAVVLDNCDTHSGWNGGARLDTEIVNEGEGCIKFTVNPSSESFVVYKSYSTAVDASGANCIEFDFWIDDESLLDNNTYFALEISSSGEWDKDEIEWSHELRYSDYTTGWNTVTLALKASTIDLTNVNFFRIFMLGIATENSVTIRIDNIRFSNRDDIVSTGTDASSSAQQYINTANTEAPETVEVPETAAPSADGQTADPDGSGSAQSSFPIVAVVGIVIAIAGIVLLAIGAMKKQKALLFAGIAAALVGAALLVFGLLQKNDPAETDGGETSGSDSETEPVIDPDDITTIYYKDTFDTTLPHAVLGEVPEENGLFATAAHDDVRIMNISERGCWILEYDRKIEGKNFMYLDADEATKAAYSGRDIALGIYYYITEPLNLTITYTKSDGSVAEIVRRSISANSRWSKLDFNLPDCALTGGVEGHDIKISHTGAELFRINMIYLREPVANISAAEGSQLVIPKYECGEYIVADYNIFNFGATGDGKTNDTEAIQMAINYAASHGGGTIFMPEGKYCLTENLTIPMSVSLVGELETGTANGTVIFAYCGKGNALGEALIKMQHGSSLRNIAIYYPEQRFVKGEPIPFPYTIEQIGTEGVDIENVTLVNAYNGIDFSSGGDSLQTVRHLYGTILNTGYYMNACWDIGRLENVCFSPKFWLESGLESIPVREELENYMLTNSVGMIIERIDWTYFSDVRIEGYNIGMLARASTDGAVNGHMYNFHFIDCFNPLVLRDVSSVGLIVSNCEFKATGGSDAVAVLCENSFGSDISFNACTISSDGKYAIVNNGNGNVTAIDSTITAAESAYVSLSGVSAFINTEVDGQENIIADTVKLDTSFDYNRYVYTKPASDSFVDMSLEPYSIKAGEDITERLQAAIDSLKDTGGMVYIPTGSYYVEDAITVHAGIELRGAMDSPHFGGSATASILTDFGRNDPDGPALFTLMDGAGMRGINFWYYKQVTAKITPYSFTIRGNGSDIYLCNLFMPSSYNGVDFGTYRCDRHYVEYIWGTPIYRGVVIGAGSEDGIVRDIQYTPNCWNAEGVVWGEAHSFIMTNSEPFVIGESSRQILYHNFTYGAWRGLTITNGARDAFVIAHGVDSGNYSAYFEGDGTAQLVNAQLVNLHGKEMNYVYTSEDFTGNVALLNTNMWGPTRGAIIKQGEGNLVMLGGEVLQSGSYMLTVSGGDMTLAGIHNRQATLRYDIRVMEDANSVTEYGNRFASGGKLRVEDVSIEKLHGKIFGTPHS